MSIDNTLIDTADGVDGYVTVFSASGGRAITGILFCNTSGNTDVKVTVYLVPVGQPVSARRMILNQISIPATETFAMDSERFLLDNGDTIQVAVDHDNILACTVSHIGL